jgi:hypothetical protein
LESCLYPTQDFQETVGKLLRRAKSMTDLNLTGIAETGIAEAGITDHDWLNQGKADAWAGCPKCPPEKNPEAASLYDLGYSEGKITHPFSVNRIDY